MKTSKAVFLSHPISQSTPLYAGRGKIVLRQVKSLKNGDSCNKMQYSFPNHSGTHVDAPLHFLANSLSITDFMAEKWIMQKINIIKVKGIGPGQTIKPADLGKVSDCQLLLIKTDFEKFRKRRCYWADSPCISPELCGWLKDRCPSLRALGVDFISVSNTKNRESQKI